MMPIIILDMDNVLSDMTLHNTIAALVFRRDVVELVRPFNVQLISGVHECYRTKLMAELERQTAWKPTAAHFTTSFAPAHLVKRRYFTDIIDPRYPDAKFIAIEDDADTIHEFQLLGIICLTLIPAYRAGRPRSKAAYMKLPQ